MPEPVTGFPDLVRIEERGGAAVVTVRGRVDAASAPMLRDALAWALTCHQRIVVDLSQASHIDRAGLNVLSTAQERAGARGVQLCFTAPSALLLSALCELRTGTEPSSVSRGFSLPAAPPPLRFEPETTG